MKLAAGAVFIVFFMMLEAHAAQQADPCTQGFAATVTQLSGKCDRVDTAGVDRLRVGTGLRADDKIKCAKNAVAKIKFCRSGEEKAISASVPQPYVVPNPSTPGVDNLGAGARVAAIENPPTTPPTVLADARPAEFVPARTLPPRDLLGQTRASPRADQQYEAQPRASQSRNYGAATPPPRVAEAQRQAQQQGSIPRMKLTDNELSCQQLYAEVKQMVKIAADAKSRHESSQGTSAAATVLSFLPFLRSEAVSVTAANKQVNAAERMQQAAARQDHLTQLFIMKKCKISDLDAKPVESSTPAPPP